jgi:hypothetical protein
MSEDLITFAIEVFAEIKNLHEIPITEYQK